MMDLIKLDEVEATAEGIMAFVQQFKDEHYDGLELDLEDVFEEQLIDRGSFGTVYSLGEHVLKVIHPSEDFEGTPYKVPTIVDEAKILSDLQSIDAFPRIHYSDKNVLVMEKVSGKPLWAIRENEFEEIPRKCWHELLADLIAVTKLGYRPIDVSANNVFWDAAMKRFRIIDVGLYSKEENIQKLHTMRFFSFYLYNELYEELNWEYQFDEDYGEPAF